MPNELLQKANKALGELVKEKKAKNVNSVDQRIKDVFTPFLERLIQANKQNQADIQKAVKEGLSNMKVSIPQNINVSSPEVNVPEANVNVSIPEIKVPTPRVSVNVPDIHVPKADAPIVNIPDQTTVTGEVSLVGINDANPLPVFDISPKGSTPRIMGLVEGTEVVTAPESLGVVSLKNSSTAILAGDAVFTGEGEDVSRFASVSIFYKSDVAAAASGLSIQFSTDNVNWDVQLVGDLAAKTFQIHSLIPAIQYFRIVYTNGSAAQSEFRLQCTFHVSRPPTLISRGGQPLATTDATPTRQTTEIDLDFARKHIPGGRSFFFFGFNDGVGTSFEDIWPAGGNINWLTSAVTVEIISSDAADDSAGLGTQSVEIHGLSATGEDQDEVIVTNGTGTTESAKTYTRINKMHNEAVGTYGGSHQGDISCYSRGGASEGVLLSIMKGEEGAADSSVQYGLGEAGNGFWSVPLGKVMYITRLSVIPNIGANKSVDVILYEREGILNTTTPFDPRRVLWDETEIDQPLAKEFKSHLKIKALTDVFFRAQGSATSKIEVSIDFYLVDADADGA
jgi:hypothetical protein